MEEAYAYSTIPGTGAESIQLLNRVIGILEEAHVELPDPEAVAFSSFSEFNGRGNSFKGKSLSLIVPGR